MAAAQPAYPSDNPWTTPTPSPVGDASTHRSCTRWVERERRAFRGRDYTMRAGSGYYPGAKHDLIDYPAGAPFSWVPTMFLPPGTPPDKVTIGVAATDATNSLD